MPHERLILVPGHAVYLDGDPTNDAAWSLLPFQHEEGRCYLEHVRRGVELAAADPTALLVFSGGRTRPGCGPCGEACGYWRLAEREGFFGHAEVRARTTTEEHARDSLENLLFGVCRFREHQGAFPDRVTVVGWRFKASRFALHAAALELADRCDYVGVNDPPDLAAATRGEAITLATFVRDPFGLGPELAAKRALRNPERHTPPYALVVPELPAYLAAAGALPAPWRHLPE